MQARVKLAERMVAASYDCPRVTDRVVDFNRSRAAQARHGEDAPVSERQDGRIPARLRHVGRNSGSRPGSCYWIKDVSTIDAAVRRPASDAQSAIGQPSVAAAKQVLVVELSGKRARHRVPNPRFQGITHFGCARIKQDLAISHHRCVNYENRRIWQAFPLALIIASANVVVDLGAFVRFRAIG